MAEHIQEPDTILSDTQAESLAAGNLDEVLLRGKVIDIFKTCKKFSWKRVVVFFQENFPTHHFEETSNEYRKSNNCMIIL